MQRQLGSIRQLGNRDNFFRTVSAAIFTGLRDRDGMRVDLMDSVTHRIDHGANGIGRQFRTLALRQHQLGREGTRCTAFIHFDMGFAVTYHTAMRLGHRA
jgi:hypothetical protein